MAASSASELCAKYFATRKPEARLINDNLVITHTVRKLVTVLAYLSLTWSTVVLLGGFVSNLKLIDFWYLTAISALFALNLAGADIYYFNIFFLVTAGKAYIGLRDELARRFWSRGYGGGRCLVVVGSVLGEACFGAVMIVSFLLFAALFYAPLGAIYLSLQRLGVDDSYRSGGKDAANAAKLNASLQIFYSLALAQSILFFVSILLHMTKGWCVSAVSREYGFCKRGKSLVWRYLRETEAVCAKEGHMPSGRNLIAFAAELLGSESMKDRRYAVRVLDIFVGKQIPVGHRLLPFKNRLENLMEALEVADGETRERAAKIVAALAGDLRHIDQFPTALQNIASLLQASSGQGQGHASDQLPTAFGFVRAAGTTMSSMEMRKRKQWRYGPLYGCTVLIFAHVISGEEEDKQEGEPKQLISQGLLIIERLAQHQGNCEHICSNHGLVSKITAPLTNSQAFLLDMEYDSEWTDILSRSMRIVARLISAPGEASRALRDGIASKTTPAVDNLTRIILEDRFGPVLVTAQN